MQSKERKMNDDEHTKLNSLVLHPHNCHANTVYSATCVVASMHIPVVVAHSIQVIQVVIWVSSQAIWPSPW